MSSEFPDPSISSNRSAKKYQGVIVPMVSPATEDGKLDDVSVARLIESFIESRVEPFLFGTTGEASSILLEEKLRMAKVICPQFVERTTVYMGISSNSFSDSVTMARCFADLGAHVAVAKSYRVTIR